MSPVRGTVHAGHVSVTGGCLFWLTAGIVVLAIAAYAALIATLAALAAVIIIALAAAVRATARRRAKR